MRKWSLYRWTWRILSPLHIGKPPAGFLDRTRLYVPARTLWGALTAELARQNSNRFPDYKGMGKVLGQNLRLSYLFPAQWEDPQWRVWLPRFDMEKGLIWYRLDNPASSIQEHQFRMWLIYTRPSTAITPETETAEDETLREHEIIMPMSVWGKEQPAKVGLTGYFFVSDELDSSLFECLKETKRLFLGGDTRYGQGWIQRDGNLQETDEFFGFKTKLTDEQGPIIITSHLLAHTAAQDKQSDHPQFVGELEYLAGRDQISNWEGLSSDGICWVPGSRYCNEASFMIQGNGVWKLVHED